MKDLNCRLILRDREAAAWHAGRLSAVVRLTRRLPTLDPSFHWEVHDGEAVAVELPPIRYPNAGPEGVRSGVRCPLGARGQRLWIAETFAYVSPCEYAVAYDECKVYPVKFEVTDEIGKLLAIVDCFDGTCETVEINIEYKADNGASHPGGWDDEPDDPEALHWRSPATMPQWASRSTAVHRGSRLAQVQEITADEAKACGVGEWQPCTMRWVSHDPRKDFREQFIRDHGQAAWDANVWVWVHRIGRE